MDYKNKMQIFISAIAINGPEMAATATQFPQIVRVNPIKDTFVNNIKILRWLFPPLVAISTRELLSAQNTSSHQLT